MLIFFLLLVAAIAGLGMWRLDVLRETFGRVGWHIEDTPRMRRRMQGIFWFALILISVNLRLAPLTLLLFVLSLATIGISLWRERAMTGLSDEPTGGARAAPPARTGAMSPAEAYAVLGLEEGADKDAVEAAFRKLISQNHPDKGGSDYLAAKINEARDVLLGP